MRQEPLAYMIPGRHRLSIDVPPGWTIPEVKERYRLDEHGKPRGLAFRFRSGRPVSGQGMAA